MDAENVTHQLPDGVPVKISNRYGWLAVLPLGSRPPEFRIFSFYLDFAGNLILQHEITKRRQVYARPFHLCRPIPGDGWLVQHMI